MYSLDKTESLELAAYFIIPASNYQNLGKAAARRPKIGGLSLV